MLAWLNGSTTEAPLDVVVYFVTDKISYCISSPFLLLMTIFLLLLAFALLSVILLYGTMPCLTYNDIAGGRSGRSGRHAIAHTQPTDIKRGSSAAKPTQSVLSAAVTRHTAYRTHPSTLAHVPCNNCLFLLVLSDRFALWLNLFALLSLP